MLIDTEVWRRWYDDAPLGGIGVITTLPVDGEPPPALPIGFAPWPAPAADMNEDR